MYAVYSLFLFLALFFYLPIYFFRIKILKSERLHLRERLGWGLPKDKALEPSLWIHAVSVGEVLSLQNLVRELKRKHPLWKINFSSLTSTGLRMAREKLEGVDNLFVIPLDFSWVVRKFFVAFKPSLLILAESEFWPNLLREARKHSQGVLLINGRISSSSFQRMRRFKFFARRMLKNIAFFLVQTEEDKEKLEKIGISPERVEVAGNLKTEVNLPLLTNEKIRALKKDLSILETKKVFVAGSTRKGEEELLLEAFREARNRSKDMLLVLAPRHPERAFEVEKISENLGFRTKRRTLAEPGEEWDVLILDTIGELAEFYALADSTFVGGSLVPWGGHNLLEPAFYAKPIFFGPHMGNFSFLADKFIHSKAAQITSNKEDLIQMFLFKNEISLREMGKRAKDILISLQGVTEKTIKTIETLMAKT